MRMRPMVATAAVALAAALPGCDLATCNYLNGLVDASACGEGLVLNNPPTADRFGMTQHTRNTLNQPIVSPHIDEPVTFEITAKDPNNDELYFEWDLDGDGEWDRTGYATGGNAEDGWTSTVTWTYGGPAVVNVAVRVSDFPQLDGGEGSVTVRRRVRVHTLEQLARDRPPHSQFTVSPDPATAGASVHFDGSRSSDPDNDPLTYTWYVRGEDVFTVAPRLDTTWDEPGEKRVGLTVTDDYGKTGWAEQMLTMLPAVSPPDAKFGISPNPAATGETVTFDAGETSDVNNDIVSYEWDIDGQPGFERTGTETRVTRTYETPGEYEVSLRVTDAGRRSTTVTHTVSVYDSAAPSGPSVTLTMSPNPARPDEYVQFHANVPAGSGVVRYEWDLDGQPGYDEETPRATTSRTYSTPGEYTVRVRVTDQTNRSATASGILQVSTYDGPTARLTIDPNPAHAFEQIGFSGYTSTDPNDDIATYEFDLDGVEGYEVVNTAPYAYAQRSYSAAGDYSVRMRVTDAAGQSDVDTDVVHVGSSAAPTPLTASGRRRRTPARAFSASLDGRGDIKTLARGRLRAKLNGPKKLSAPERLLKSFLGADWRTRLDKTSVNRAAGQAKVTGYALATAPRGRVCVKLAITLHAKALPHGTFELLGGSGNGKKLRGSGSYRFKVEAGKPATVLGTLRAGSGRARGLPRACARLRRPPVRRVPPLGAH